MNIKKLAAVAAMTSLSGVLLLLAGQSTADTLVVDNELFCDSISNVSWANGRLTVVCDGVTNTPNTPVPNTPVPNTPVPNTPVTPVPNTPVISSDCGVPEPDVMEASKGRGLSKEFTLANGTVLVVPYASGSVGEVSKLSFIQPGSGEHFRKTIIVSKCKGVYNPEDYDYKTSVDVCVFTGLELSVSVITGQNRADYPVSSYRCVLEQNQQYYINVFQFDSGSRPPYASNRNNTCRTNRCGVRVAIR